MAAREKVPDGAEPLIIKEGGEPTGKDDKPADKSGCGPRKHPDDRRRDRRWRTDSLPPVSELK